MNIWTKIPSDQGIEEVISALNDRNISAEVVNSSKEAKEKVLGLLQEGDKILTSSSVTLESIGLKDEIDNSDKYVSVRKQYMALDHEKNEEEIRILRSAPEVIIGSVHALTKKGEILIASNTGNQLSSYAYSAKRVILVVGAQKIVANIEEGQKRIYEYTLPLVQKLYGDGTSVSKLLIINKEKVKDRIKLILIKEALGY